jgi:hypothetical protein
LNGLAYFPDPSFVPLLVGMYNGEIIVDEDTIERAKTNNGFDNKTGAFVISRNAVLEIVLKNQIGEIGISVPHPVFLYYIYLTWCSSICTEATFGISVPEAVPLRTKHSKRI